MNFEKQELPKKGDTVIVGMSGGVDSTLVTYLLKEKGCRVIGVTMSIWDGKLPCGNTEGLQGCYSPTELTNIAECTKFCKENDIEYHVVDVKEIYQQKVIEYFKTEYRNGRTPNPCIRCNQYVKFGALLSGVEKLGINYDYFCTGHYASIVRPILAQGESCAASGAVVSSDSVAQSESCAALGAVGAGLNEAPYMIATSSDATKDQTYFLYRVSSETLKKVRFPLTNLKKSEVFELAKKANLQAAERHESQDFVDQRYIDMFFSDKPSVPGDIIDLDGKVLGRHKGIEHYTVGQRRGLGVAVSYPVYVHSIDAKTNTVVLAPNDALNANSLIADDFVWAIQPSLYSPDGIISANVKIRLASKPTKAQIEPYTPSADDTYQYVGQPYRITFETTQRAIAPGQSAVLYSDEGVILGGGIISHAE